MKTVRINRTDLCYEIFGEEHDVPILLISGLGSQMIRWEDSFCELLSGKGFRVIRFDNRDSGCSVFYPEKDLDFNRDIHEIFSSLQKEGIPYSLMDMAEDVIGLMDHLNIEKAHIAGRSMGGIIAQLLGANFPERILTLTIIMSTSLHPALPPADPEVMAMMMKPSADPVSDRALHIREKLDFAHTISGSLYPADPNVETELIEKELSRSSGASFFLRQVIAMGTMQYNPEMLKKIKAPTLIIHGTEDPIFHPDCGKDLARSIPDAELVFIEGMGHSIPRDLFDFISEKISDHCCKKLYSSQK